MQVSQIKELAKTGNLPNHSWIGAIKTHNTVQGYYFFNENTMRGFKSRVHSDVYGGCVFVTSEKNSSWRFDYPRAYTVRMITENGSIETIGEFQGFDTRYSAHAYAKWVGEVISEQRQIK